MRVFENRTALPRVWLVTEVVSAKPEDILKAIHTSVLPDGRRFEPREMALIEEAFDFHAETPNSNAKALVTELNNTSMTIQTSAATPSFLVMSDVFYPGWEASVNGVATRILRTNYALRGIMLPAGKNAVRVQFTPRIFWLGATVTIVCLLIVVALLCSYWRQKRRLTVRMDASDPAAG